MWKTTLKEPTKILTLGDIIDDDNGGGYDNDDKTTVMMKPG